MIIYTRNGRQIQKSFATEQLTGKHQDNQPPKGERDAFDTLFDYGPDKLQHVKGSLVAFCNKHLNKINLEVTDLETQFQVRKLSCYSKKKFNPYFTFHFFRMVYSSFF